MKIAQFLLQDRICLGRVNGNEIFPVNFKGDMVDFLGSKREMETSGEPIPLNQVRWVPPVSRPSKIIAIGLNYMDHIRESKGTPPDEPLVFAKFPNSLQAHRESIVWEGDLTGKVDFEAELAVILGDSLHRCHEDDVMKKIFGYSCANDVSARDLQFGDGQWVRGKSLDTFCPLGPWIVTSDEIDDPHDLGIRALLNGETMQESNTGEMLFKLPQLISYLSKNFTLCPGDIVLTGTPHGVGTFRDPSVYMKDGDEIVVEIDGIGRLVNNCKVL